MIHPNAAEIDGLTGYRMIVEWVTDSNFRASRFRWLPDRATADAPDAAAQGGDYGQRRFITAATTETPGGPR